jgi:hypothetical protein
LLGKAFDGLNDGLRKEISKASYERRRSDFVFHMTDWLDDLGELNDIYQHPERMNTTAACERLYGILVHMVPHLRAAGRALEGKEISDPFVEKPHRTARKVS